MTNIRFDLTILIEDLATFNQEQAETQMISWLNGLKKVDTSLDNELNN
jgi:hypothetical protein